MSTDLLVSVIVASHNHERFVEDALQSLVAQTYQPLELIVLDDGSTDATFEHVEALLPELRRRFVRVHAAARPHEGSASTIARCLELARSDLVYMLDSDDVALPDAIGELLPHMDDAAVAVAVGDNYYMDADGLPSPLERDGEPVGTLLAFHTKGRADFSLERDFGSYKSLIGGNYVPNGWLLRRRAVGDVGGYTPDFVLDDWSILLRLTKRYRIAYAGKVLAKYRVHAENTHRVHAERLFLDTARILLQERAYCFANGLEREWCDHAGRLLRAATPEQLEQIDFFAALLPEVDPARVSLLKTLASSGVAQRARETEQLTGARAVVTGPPPPASLGQRIHLYAVCWNDARTLPFFFRHYDPWVQRYVIFDDGSTDGSLELLRAHPRVEVRRFTWAHADSYVLSELEHYDQAWKASRGEADWVVVCDIDEHIFHPDLPAYLARCLDQGVTAIPAIGYEMVSEAFPESNERLCLTRTIGTPAAEMSKLSVFSPGALEATGYAPGGHTASPVGRIVAPPRDELLLLHYKLLGLEYAVDRHEALAKRLRQTDLERDWGHHWLASRAELSAAFEACRAQSIDLASPDQVPILKEPTAVWWGHFSRAKNSTGLLESALEERDRLWAALQASEGERSRTVQHLDATAARVSALESSRTWRWSRPARRVIDVLAHIRAATRRGN